MRISQREMCEGSLLPPWYFGLTYQSDISCHSVFHILPLNYLIRFGLLIRHCWGRLRYKKSWFDKRIREVGMEGFRKGFDEGFKQGEDDGKEKAMEFYYHLLAILTRREEKRF